MSDKLITTIMVMTLAVVPPLLVLNWWIRARVKIPPREMTNEEWCEFATPRLVPLVNMWREILLAQKDEIEHPDDPRKMEITSDVMNRLTNALIANLFKR